MLFPHDKFITFLLSRRADVNETLRCLNVRELTANELIQRDLRLGILPKNIADYLDDGGNPAKIEGFMAWAKSLEIHELWEIQREFITGVPRPRAKDIANACTVFKDMERRTAFILLSARGFESGEIQEIFSEHYNIELNDFSVQIAQKYFFDFDRLSESEVEDYIQTLPETYGERVRVLQKPHTRAMIEYAAGRAPQITFEEVLQDIMATAYFKFKETCKNPVRDNVAMKWANLAMRAGENRARYTRGDTNSLSDEIQLRFEFQKPAFKTLAELNESNESDKPG